MKNKEYFGRLRDDGNVDVLYADGGGRVIQIEEWDTIYPVNSHLSCAWEHPEGIVLSIYDAKELRLTIE